MKKFIIDVLAIATITIVFLHFMSGPRTTNNAETKQIIEQQAKYQAWSADRE